MHKLIWRATLLAPVSLLLAAALAVSQQRPVSCPGGGPLSEEQLRNLMMGKVSPDRTIEFIRVCGVSFPMNGAAEDRLKRAGATEPILAAVRAKAPKPAPVDVGANAPSKTPAPGNRGSPGTPAPPTKTANPAAAPAPPAEPKADLAVRAELDLWNTIKDSSRTDVFEDYLRRYPQGQFAAPALARIGDLTAGTLRPSGGASGSSVADRASSPPPAASPPRSGLSGATNGTGSPPASRDPFDLALFYQRSGDYLKAVEQYQKILDKDRSNQYVYNNLGLIHQAMANNLEAVKAFQQAILIDPNYDKAHNNLGTALLRLGQEAEAQREFNSALAINPKNAEALTNLAILAKRLGKLDEAKTQLLKALQVNPSNPETHYNLAVLYEEQGDTPRAIEHFKEFLKNGSTSYPDMAREVESKIEELSKKE